MSTATWAYYRSHLHHPCPSLHLPSPLSSHLSLDGSFQEPDGVLHYRQTSGRLSLGRDDVVTAIWPTNRNETLREERHVRQPGIFRHAMQLYRQSLELGRSFRQRGGRVDVVAPCARVRRGGRQQLAFWSNARCLRWDLLCLLAVEFEHDGQVLEVR